MGMYKPKYFKLEEFIPEIVHLRRGELAWELLDPKMVQTWDELREMRGHPISLNTWCYGGSKQNQCLRTCTYYNGQNSYSQHPLGKAGDGLEKSYDSIKEQVEFIRTVKALGALKHLTGIEVGEEWLHLDTRVTDRCNDEGLFFFTKEGIINIEEYVWP